MYERHFGLRENPFPAGHQLRFLYPSREHQEARAHLRYGIENREPFVLITGEVGTGKTTALYDALAEWGAQVTVALITNSALSRQELLEEICLRFGLTPAPGISKPQMLAALERHLTSVRNRGEHAVLLLDESQNLPIELLEEIRLLSNTELQGEKLLQIFLVGQPELEAKLSRPELRQLRQRITVHYRLNPLSPEETTGYIQHRLSVAGGNAISIFPGDACREVYRLTHGIPREINTVAAQALLAAFSEGARSVRPDHVSAVSVETEFRSVLGAPDAAPAAAYEPPAPVAPAPPAPPAAPVAPAPPAPPAAPVAPAAPAPPAEPAPPHVLDDTRTPVPTWTPPELAAEEVQAFTPPALPEEPAGDVLPHVEDDRDLDVVEKQELDAWTRAAQELLEAKRRGDAADAAPSAPPAAPVAAEPDAPRFPTAGELAEMGATADPTNADLSRLPGRLRDKIEADIAADERKGGAMPVLLGLAAVAALVVAAVLLQRFQVIDVPFLRPLAGTPAATDSLAAHAKPATPAPADSAAADSTAMPDSNAVVTPRDTTIATKAKPFEVKPAAPTPTPAPAAATPAATTPAATAKPAAATPTSVYGIGVAAFLDRDRAEAERTRLATATGLEARIYPFKDGSTTMYRLVLGHFASNGAAETKANDLMQKDLVREARVMVIGGGAAR